MNSAALIDVAAQIQRRAIERVLLTLRTQRGIEALKFCPSCFPELFDASLQFTPNPVFCRAHAKCLLAQSALKLKRDETGAARPILMGGESH